jgi:hypothetical protein
MVHAALLLLMLEAVPTDLVFTISLKRSTPNLQLSTSWPADYPIFGAKADKKRGAAGNLFYEYTAWSSALVYFVQRRIVLSARHAA